MNKFKHIMFSVLLVLSSSAFAAGYTLPRQEWRLISLPAAPPAAENTLDKVFGDDIPGAYGTDWVLFEYNTGANQYRELNKTDSVKQGVGYWIIQLAEDQVTLNLPAGSLHASVSSIALASSRSQATQWNLVSFLFSEARPLGDFSVEVSNADLCGDAGCSLDLAKDKHLVHNKVWTYNGQGYEEKGTADSLNPWEGFWVAALPDSQGKHLSLTEGEGKVYPPTTDFNPITEVPMSRPAKKFASYQDTAFDNEVIRTVTRLTDRENNQKGANSHPYPKQGAAWNSDMSLLKIDRRIYDAETLREIPLTKEKSGGEVDAIMKGPQSGSSGIRWSKKDPGMLFVMSSDNNFYQLTLSNDRTTFREKLIYSFGDVGKFGAFTIGHDEGNIDYDDHYVVLSATKSGEIPTPADKIYAVLLDIQNGRKVGKVKELKYTSGGFDWISISPSGKYILVTANDMVDLYDANTFQEIRSDFTNDAGHGDIGIDENGDEIYVQLEKGGAGIFGYVLKDQVLAMNAGKQLLDSNYGGGHVSCRNHKLPGWCYVSTNEKDYREVFAVRLDGSKTVRRFAQVHQRGNDSPGGQVGNKYYYAQDAFVNVSQNGTRVLFWSDYGNPEKFLYYDADAKKDGADAKKAAAHYQNRDTYQVTISK